MQMVSEVMTRNVQFVTPHESLQRAAQMMDELNVGVLPVCDGDKLVGMVTDRDITVRATAAGKAPQEAHVDEVMSTNVRWCFEDQPLDDVMRKMADSQIRRVPVVSHDDQHRLIGIVALGDLMTKTPDGGQKQDVEQTMEKVSSPSEPDRSPAGATAAVSDEASTRSSGGGSNTGTATGFAGSDALGAAGRDDMIPAAGMEAASETGLGTEASPDDASPEANPRPASRAKGARVAGGTSIASGAGVASHAGGDQDPVRTSGAPGGIDAAGPSGASGGTAGTAGSAGTGVGGKP